jgi:hypothetical protein
MIAWAILIGFVLWLYSKVRDYEYVNKEDYEL